STTDRNLTAHAGAVLIRAAAHAVGLGGSIAAHLHLKKRARGLTEAESILGMAEAITLGATCLDDLAIARSDQAQKELRGFALPAPQTAGSFLRRFTLGHIGQLNKALRAVHLRAFHLLGISAGDRVTLDFDSTYIRSYSSQRQGADPTWTKRYTLHPLLCFVAEFSTCLHAKLRRGKAHTSNGIAGFVDECLRRVPTGSLIRARFDSGFYSKDLFAKLEDRGVTYLCGVVLIPRLTSIFTQIPDACWVPCADKDEGEVAEFGYRTRDDKTFRRYVVKRIPVNIGEQMEIESGGYHHWVLVTNDHDTDAVALESEHRHKALVESGMRELKENFGLDVLRKHGFMANWAWLLVVVTALNLTRWSQLLGSLDEDGDMRAKRLRYRYLNVPALLVRSGRRIVLKLQRDYPLLDRFVAALTRLQSLPLPAG
ncbi:MAG TPA: IS1380 family transposase, partial [Ilumatobacteraceae bacterium]|nr:IS1380 family transposase [Ilumatobacteraceae bacterium]